MRDDEQSREFSQSAAGCIPVDFGSGRMWITCCRSAVYRCANPDRDRSSHRGPAGSRAGWDIDPALLPGTDHRQSAPLAKDLSASRITYEPLASFDRDSRMVPFLAAEVPSLENGQVAADGTSVIWQLRQDIQLLDQEASFQQELLQAELNTGREQLATAQVITIVSAVVVILSGLLVAFAIANDIARPIVRLTEVADTIKAGNLTARSPQFPGVEFVKIFLKL